MPGIYFRSCEFLRVLVYREKCERRRNVAKYWFQLFLDERCIYFFKKIKKNVIGQTIGENEVVVGI